MTKKNFTIDFNKGLKKVLIGYAAVILVGVVIACLFGVKLDINFKGGTVISYNYHYDDANGVADIDTEAVKTMVTEKLSADATVTKSSAIATDAYTLTVSLVKNESVDTAAMESLTEALQEKYADNKVTLYSSTSVSPSLAGVFFLKSLAAVLLTGILVVIYVGIRFRKIGGITAGLTSLAALMLDVLVSFFICVIFRLQVDSNYIAVVLTILGYSLNDTIVVYDSVREFKRLDPQLTTAQLVNKNKSTFTIS